MTAQEAIERAFRLLGVYDAGGSPTTSELNDGLECLNSLAAFWGAQSWGPSYHVQDSKALTISDGSYTIGSGQDIDTVLPTKIVSAWIRDSGGYDTPLEIISQEEYAAIYDKDITGTPEKLCYVKSSTTGTIYLYPEPDAADTLYIESLKRLGNYALSDQLGLPLEYERPLCSNLAIDMALEFGVEPSPSLYAIAEQSLQSMKAMNAQPVPQIVTDTVGFSGGKYNIYTDG